MDMIILAYGDVFWWCFSSACLINFLSFIFLFFFLNEAYFSLNDVLPWKEHVQIIFCWKCKGTLWMLFLCRVSKNAFVLLDREIIGSELTTQWRFKCNFHGRGPSGTLPSRPRWGRAAWLPSLSRCHVLPWNTHRILRRCPIWGHGGSYQMDSDLIIWFFHSFGIQFWN